MNRLWVVIEAPCMGRSDGIHDRGLRLAVDTWHIETR